MTKQQRRFFSAQTLEQAVVQAARHFGVDPSQISYREVEKRHGFLKVRRTAVIEVDPQAIGLPVVDDEEFETVEIEEKDLAVERTQEETLAPMQEEGEPATERTTGDSREREDKDEPGAHPAKAEAGLTGGPRRASDKYPPAEGDAAEAAREAIAMTLELAGLNLDFAVLQGEERLEIELWGEDEKRLLADRGQVLLAIQLLMPRIVRGKIGRLVPFRVDCGDFHEIREERLRDLAQRVAGEVRNAGRPRRLRPMSPDERRIVHITLTDDPAVTTESEGEGYFKRVRIFPN